MFIRLGKNKWMIAGKDYKEDFVMKGRYLINNHLKGELRRNGEIQWDNGMTSRLKEPCPSASSCSRDFLGLDGTRGRSWFTWDLKRETYERFRFYK